MSLARSLTVAGAGLAAALTVSTSSAAAVPAYAVTTDGVQAAAGWLATQFTDGRYLPTPAGDRFVLGVYGGTTYLNYGEDADAVFGLAAAKVAGAKVSAAMAFLAANVDAYADISNADGYGPGDGAIAKTALAAIVAGADPSAVGGFDLLTQLRNGECTAVDGSACVAIGGSRNTYTSIGESFVVLAEARAGGAHAPSAAKTGYFLSLQCTGGADVGGFTGALDACGSGAADLDATSYAAMALEALGGHQAELTKAVAWLKAQQQAGGYWVDQGVANTDSTGLAAAALQGADADVTSARTWLRSQQTPTGRPGAGAIAFGGTVDPSTVSATSPSVIATAQALTGLVDGGGLATVSATGASPAIPVFAPTTTVSTARPQAGHPVTVTGAGFVAGEQVTVSVQSAPVTVATVPAGPLGGVAATFTVPASLSGAHTIVLTGVTSNLTATLPVTVTGGVVTPAPSSVAPSTTSTSAGSSAGSSAGPTAASSAGSTATPGTSAAEPVTGQAVAETGQDRRSLDILAGAGGIAVVAGAALLLLGRRRTH